MTGCSLQLQNTLTYIEIVMSMCPEVFWAHQTLSWCVFLKFWVHSAWATTLFWMCRNVKTSTLTKRDMRWADVTYCFQLRWVWHVSGYQKFKNQHQTQTDCRIKTSEHIDIQHMATERYEAIFDMGMKPYRLWVPWCPLMTAQTVCSIGRWPSCVGVSGHGREPGRIEAAVYCNK